MSDGEIFEAGDVIDGKYTVTREFESTGGMGTLVFVTEHGSETERLLKYCDSDDPTVLKRFRREVRLVESFRGNDKVIQLVDSNVDHEPPYFVMKYYKNGDLTNLNEKQRKDFKLLEKVFDRMIDCIATLHAAGKFHRDIKPHNFLRIGSLIFVSDLGLGTEIGSETAFTRKLEFWGTKSYAPPEFYMPDGFRLADARSDIFMLGKSFYNILTDLDPQFLHDGDIPRPLYWVILRCSDSDKSRRYKDLAELRQSLQSAFDAVLERTSGLGKAEHLLEVIRQRMKLGRYKVNEIGDALEAVGALAIDDRMRICHELDSEFFQLMTTPKLHDCLRILLPLYREMVEDHTYSFSFAEHIADCMRHVFTSNVGNDSKVVALELGIIAATRQNRFAAMDTCQVMIRSVTDEALGALVAQVLLRHPEDFITGIAPAECRCDSVGRAIAQLKLKRDADTDMDLGW